MKKSMLLACAAALALSVTVSLAQDADKGKAKTPSPPRTAASIECSKQADAKGLHGQARRTFRSKCKRGLGKGQQVKGIGLPA